MEAELAAIADSVSRCGPDGVKAPDQYAWRIVVTVVTYGIYLLWWFADQRRRRALRRQLALEDHLAQAVQNLQDQPAA